MAKRNPARQKFKTVAKAANTTCHRETNSLAAFKKCMSREMKKGLRKQGFKVGGAKRKGGKSSMAHCKGVTNKGRLKKGYKWVAKGRCPRKVAAR